jgi:hypothetical protein
MRYILDRILLFAILTLGWISTALSQTAPDVDLNLYEKSEVDRSKGCSIVLWQDDRDPETDKYAYIFTEKLVGEDNKHEPAHMKIGGKDITLTRIATGGKTNGYDLYEYQLYKLPGDNDYVVQTLQLDDLMGENIEINSGKLIIAMDGFPIFRASVKGNAGCNSPAAGDDGAAAPAAAGMFEPYDLTAEQVDMEVLAAAQKQFDCKPAVMKTGVKGFQMSEESAIWQIPCDTFGKQTANLFALVYLTDPKENLSFVKIDGPKGHPRPVGESQLMSPTWDVKTRTVTGISLGSDAGDCGVLESYKVNESGGFDLIEYREKKACDGKVVKPSEFARIFPAP